MALALVVLLVKDPAVVPGVRSLIDQHNRLGSVVAVLIVAVATQSALVFLALTGRHRGPSPVTVGQAAPSFRLPDLRHHTVASEDLLARGRPLLVLFVDPGCSPCHALQPEVAGWMSDLSGALEVVAVTTGSHDRNHDRFDLLDPSRVLVQKTDEVASRFGFGGTPSAIVIAADGTLDSEIALGGREIRRLVGRTLPTGFVAAPARPIDPGDRAPAFRLMTGSGDEIDLVSDGDRPQLVLFWDREGGDRAHEPVLLELEQRLVRGGLKVIIVTSGRSQSGLGLFRSPVALDPDRLVQTAFGVTELPGAALVGRGGVLASHVAIGLAEVTALVAAADATAQVAERLADTTTG
jgi:peroxiredoxin